MSTISSLVPLLISLFLARLVSSSEPTHGDYFSFVVLGLVGFLLVNGTMTGLGLELDSAIQQGRIEMLLIEPIRWRFIPLALSLWPATMYSGIAVIGLVVSAALGAHYRWSGLPVALVISVLAIVAAFAIGTLASSVRLISKKTDPIATLLLMVVSVVCGLWYPISVLPKGLRLFAWLLPNTYVFSGLRKALMPGAGQLYGPGVLTSILVLALLDVVIFAAGFIALGRSLEYGRNTGILATY